MDDTQISTDEMDETQIFTDAEIAEVVYRLRDSVGKWILEIPLGSETWKQFFKKRFVFLTQFSDPGRRKALWKDDLKSAAWQTVAKKSPKWQLDKTDACMYQCIQQAMNKHMDKSPRQDWLQQKAYLWLKLLHILKCTEIWYPHHAIEVAHRLFLSDSKLQTWKNYLSNPTRKRQEPIGKLLNEFIPIIVAPIGL